MVAASPVLLLKSPSPSPDQDAYALALAAPSSTPSLRFQAHFIPVLTHTLLPDPLIKLLLTYLDPASTRSSTIFPYGALILTSQRAVAALNAALSSPILQAKVGAERLARLGKGGLRMYVVGPATEKAAREVVSNHLPGVELSGGQAGNGEALARMMLGEGERGRYDVYEEDEECIANGEGGDKMVAGRTRRRRRRKPVLFLVGETRRDVIPRMLQSTELAEEERVGVEEMVVYQSSELQEFEFDFRRVLARTKPPGGSVRWTVVFSPMAGKGMLRGLGWLGEGSGRVSSAKMQGRTDFACCIGPTTRAYLLQEFGFQADVVAEKPSPEGVREGITKYTMEHHLPGTNQDDAQGI